MSTFDNPKEELIIGDIPIRKWINVMIRCEQHKLDIFINGMMTRSHILKGVPKQNYDNVYIGLNGGFAGQISKLQYFGRNLNNDEIRKIYENGPYIN